MRGTFNIKVQGNVRMVFTKVQPPHQLRYMRVLKVFLLNSPELFEIFHNLRIRHSRQWRGAVQRTDRW